MTEPVHFEWIKERFGRVRILGRQVDVIVARLENTSRGASILKLHKRWTRGRKEGEILKHLAGISEKGPGGIVTPGLFFSEAVVRDSLTGEWKEIDVLSRPCKGGFDENAFWVLGMEDVRIGRDARARRLPRKDLQAATRVLAAIHHGTLPEFLVRSNGWEAGWRRLKDRRAVPGLPEALKRNLSALVYIGDSLCHNDLHPSNWITKGIPVGLLDWAAAEAGDPEADLAALLLALDTPWAALGDKGRRELESQTEGIFDVWESFPSVKSESFVQRTADPGRMMLYLWLSVVEELSSCEIGTKDHGRRSDLLTLAGIVEQTFSGMPVSLGCVERVRDRCEETTDTENPGSGPMDARPSRTRWKTANQEMIEPIRHALMREGVIRGGGWIAEVFAKHACNDVARFKGPNGESFVAKVYNKPLPPFLFPLENKFEILLDRAVSTKAASTSGGCSRHVRVPAPLVLPSGRRVFRVGNRLAALYRDYGDRELKNSKRDMELLARAHAEFHRVGCEVRHYLDGAADGEPLNLDECLEVGNELVKTVEEKDLLKKTVSWLESCVRDAEKASEAELIPAFLHGSLHRDHCLSAFDDSVVIFDLEKASWGHRIRDAAVTAYYMGYRCNDEKMDPSRIAYYFLCYDRAASPRLTREEKKFAVPYLMRAFFHDLRVLGGEGRNTWELRRHLLFLLDFFWNRKRFQDFLQIINSAERV